MLNSSTRRKAGDHQEASTRPAAHGPRSAPDRAPRRERQDLAVRVSESLVEDLGGVLPDARRLASKPRRALAHVDGEAETLDRTVARMIEL
jgi:hypothetical protein